MQRTKAQVKYKDRFGRHDISYHRDETAVRPSYPYISNVYSDKTTPL